MQETIRSNLEVIREKIASAAERSGRRVEDITLIAVSKMHPAEDVDAAALCGVTDFGENKVQELTGKQALVRSRVNWHLIGHLQTNKVKNVIGRVCLIHSVDSLRLAEEIDKRSAAAGTVTDILLQVNAAGEESKFGLCVKDAEALAYRLQEGFDSIRLRGLMQIAPYSEDPEDIRGYLREVAELYSKLKNGGVSDLDILSMGMSHDFETAIEEGATHVRIGTSIFGQRDYSK